jgi:MFS family permease
MNILKRPRFFYGWVIVAVLAVNSGVGIAMGLINFGFFIKPMGDELGISRSTFGWAQTTRTLTGAAASPVVGRAIDRFGVRWLMPIAAIITGAGMFAMAAVDAGWQMVLIFAVIGFIGIGGGQTLLNTVPVAKWFVHQRATATALVIMGIPIGILILAPVTEFFVSAYGWRTAWALLGVIGIAIIVPTSVFFIRREPADMGLHPDGNTALRSAGDTSERDHTETTYVDDEVSWTRSEAIHTTTFWRLVAVFSVLTLAQSTLGLHRIPNFVDRGIDPTMISFALSAESVAAIITSLVMGPILGRFQSRHVGGFFVFLMAVSMVLNITGNNVAALFFAFITFGFGIQGVVVLQHYIWAEYYGREHLGSIRGTMLPVTLLFSAIGPPGAGYVYDLMGSYNTIWWFSAGAMVLAAFTLALTQRPQKNVVRPEMAPELG